MVGPVLKVCNTRSWRAEITLVEITKMALKILDMLAFSGKELQKHYLKL